MKHSPIVLDVKQEVKGGLMEDQMRDLELEKQRTILEDQPFRPEINSEDDEPEDDEDEDDSDEFDDEEEDEDEED